MTLSINILLFFFLRGYIHSYKEDQLTFTILLVTVIFFIVIGIIKGNREGNSVPKVTNDIPSFQDEILTNPENISENEPNLPYLNNNQTIEGFRQADNYEKRRIFFGGERIGTRMQGSTMIMCTRVNDFYIEARTSDGKSLDFRTFKNPSFLMPYLDT